MVQKTGVFQKMAYKKLEGIMCSSHFCEIITTVLHLVQYVLYIVLHTERCTSSLSNTVLLLLSHTVHCTVMILPG